MPSHSELDTTKSGDSKEKMLQVRQSPVMDSVPAWKPLSLMPQRTSERQEMPLVGGFGCLELLLYGIRVLTGQFLESTMSEEEC